MKFWYEKNILALFLLPLSWMYLLIISIRKFLYRFNIKKITQFNVPIVVVGNITVGGTGKTAFVIWLAKVLQKNGYRPGIVSRGYKGKSKEWPQIVGDDSRARSCGDEAVLLRKQTQCPMVVDPNRVRAVQTLLHHFDCDVVISDDGLQHYALYRDVEIALMDGERLLGNEYLLPAGPLREKTSRLNTVDFIVMKNTGSHGECRRIQLNNIYNMHYRPNQIRSVLNNELLDEKLLKNKKWHAVAAIGNPQSFFDLLRQLNFEFEEHVFPDHYQYRAEDINFGEEGYVIMTEKDSVKCLGLVDWRHYYLPVVVEVE